MTEQTEWRSGDVVVTEWADSMWLIDHGGGRTQIVHKVMFPNPAALAEFVDSQQPKPRWVVRDSDSSEWAYDVLGPVGSVHARIVAQCDDPRIGDLLATALIARDGDEADR